MGDRLGRPWGAVSFSFPSALHSCIVIDLTILFTVAILAQGASWAVAATQAFSFVWNNILSSMTLISHILFKSNSIAGPLNTFRIMLDTFRGMMNTLRSIINTFRNRLKYTPSLNAFSECN